MAPKPDRIRPQPPLKPRASRPVYEVPDDFDLLIEQELMGANSDDPFRNWNIGMLRYRHQMVWGDLSRKQLAFLAERLTTFLADTSPENFTSYTYVMTCRHTHVSPFRLSSQARVICPEHGFQRLDPRHNAQNFLPTWREWVDGHSEQEQAGPGSR
jgi:hypothetical protein